MVALQTSLLCLPKLMASSSRVLLWRRQLRVYLAERKSKNGYQRIINKTDFFQDVKIPVENLLGEAGKGHLIAFNILNIGRLKLAAATVGGGRRLCNTTIQYATQREQFKKLLLHSVL